jgi:hypothetical protein
LDTFVVPARPLNVTFDPDNWLLDSIVLTHIEETESGGLRIQKHGPTVVRNVLHLPASLFTPHSSLFDFSGRKVLSLHPGANDVRSLAPGVYFLRSASGVAKLVVSR